MRYIYLHGFASGPSSRKARFFVEKMGQVGAVVEAVDLAPDFEKLTITNQLLVLEDAIKGEPVTLIGSSLGGYLAALYAVQHPEVERVILLAPAFDFYHLWLKELTVKKLDDWRKNGTVLVFHYGLGRKVPLGYQLMSDAALYPGFPDFPQPCLIVHGLNDVVVPIQNSAQFAAGRPNVELISLKSGHELTDVLDEIWKAASTFLTVADTNGV